MSGHSKWANIKHKKGKSDAQKAKVFTKIGRELQIAVKSGGPDPESNSKQKDVIAKAKAAKGRANVIAVIYNDFMKSNTIVWNGSRPTDIEIELLLIE